MRDFRALLTRVQSGIVPSAWRVIRPNREFLEWRSIIFVVTAAAALAVLGYTTFAGAVIGIGVRYDTSERVLLIWQIVDLFGLLGLIVLCGVQAARSMAARDTVDAQFLILTPDGFVMRTDPDDKHTVEVDYRDIMAMRVVDLVGTVYLVMRVVDMAKPKRVLIDGRFGKPSQLAREIIADFTMAVGQAPPNLASQI